MSINYLFCLYLFIIFTFISSCQKDDLVIDNSISQSKSSVANLNPPGLYVDPEPIPAISFDFIAAGDPQAFQLDGSEPGYNGDPNSSKNRDLWERINLATASSINMLPNIKFVSINGDITEFGRQESWDSFYKVYGSVKFPLFIGLGNHDYDHNINYCWESIPYVFPSGCAYSSVIKLLAHVSKLINSTTPKIKNFDYNVHNAFWPWDNYFTGSFSYSWDVEDVHFVQLNNYPSYQATIKGDMVFSALSIYIKNSLNWLENDLKNNRKPYVILNFHDGTDDFINKTSSADREKFKKIITKYNVAAIFLGHTHEFENLTGKRKDFYGDIPVFTVAPLFNYQYFYVRYTRPAIVRSANVEIKYTDMSTGKPIIIKTDTIMKQIIAAPPKLEINYVDARSGGPNIIKTDTIILK